MFVRRLAQLSTRQRPTAQLMRGGHGGGPKINEPGGYLFNRKPGVKYEREGWEVIWIGGFTIAFAMVGLGVYYKPDTRIRTWARVEAERQMREEGDLLAYKHTEYRA